MQESQKDSFLYTLTHPLCRKVGRQEQAEESEDEREDQGEAKREVQGEELGDPQEQEQGALHHPEEPRASRRSFGR